MQPCCCDGIHILLEGEVGGGAEQVTFETKVRTVVKGTRGRPVEVKGLWFNLNVLSGCYKRLIREADIILVTATPHCMNAALRLGTSHGYRMHTIGSKINASCRPKCKIQVIV